MSIINQLEEARKIFTDEVDEETREDNLAKITEWEQGIMRNEALGSWLEHDITQDILQKARQAYKEFAISLASNRNLTEAHRQTIYAKQDALLWIISLGTQEPKKELVKIESEIRFALGSIT